MSKETDKATDKETDKETTTNEVSNAIPLTQEQFEAMWWTKDPASPYQKGFFIYFTAAWCKPCKLLDQPAIEAAIQTVGVPYYKCDETINKYTSGYCNIRKFPTFQFCKPKALVGSLSSANTEEVVAWIHGFV